MSQNAATAEPATATSVSVAVRRADLWSDTYVDRYVMPRTSPPRSLFKAGDRTAALGSGFSTSLRRPPMSREHKTLHAVDFESVLPLGDGARVDPASLLRVFERVFRDKGEDRTSANFRAKRALRKVGLLVVTLSPGPWSDVRSLRQDLTKACRLWRKHSAAPLVFAIDVVPSSDAAVPQSVTEAFAARAALRVAIDEMIREKKDDIAFDVHYFPALELTVEFADRFDDDGASVHKPIGDALVRIFCSYYGENGPDVTETGKNFIDAKLRMVRLAHKAVAQFRQGHTDLP